MKGFGLLFRLALTFYLASTLNPLYAQLVTDKTKDTKQLPVLRTNEKTLRVIVDGKEQKNVWVINPTIRPDILKTSGKKVMFRSTIDSITFDIAKGEHYDFVVVTNKGDSAMTQIQWVSENPLEEPSQDILKRSANGLISKKQALFDIDALIYTLSEVHPNMFSICTQSDFFQSLAMMKEQIPDSITTVQLFKLVAPLVTKLGDGHTMLRFPHNDYFTPTTPRLPLYVRVKPDYTLQVERCVDNLIPIDTEILSINGKSSREMIQSMMDYASGERDFFKIECINADFSALFEMLYASEKYDIVYRLKNSKKKAEITLPSVKIAELKACIPRKAEAYTEQDYSFRLMENKNAAIMDFRSFDNPGKMKVFADSMFATLHEKGIKNLIIDLRYNDGGNSVVGDIFLRYISPKPFRQMGKSLVRITPTTGHLIGSNSTTPGWYFYNSETSNKLIQPLTNKDGHYEGHIYLLISHQTFSSASSFAWAFKHFGMGTVIGEESGGMNVSFGDLLSYHLPVSNLHCTISFKRFWLYGANEKNIHGTLPDHEVDQAKALEVALKLIKSKK